MNQMVCETNLEAKHAEIICRVFGRAQLAAIGIRHAIIHHLAERSNSKICIATKVIVLHPKKGQAKHISHNQQVCRDTNRVEVWVGPSDVRKSVKKHDYTELLSPQLHSISIKKHEKAARNRDSGQNNNIWQQQLRPSNSGAPLAYLIESRMERLVKEIYISHIKLKSVL